MPVTVVIPSVLAPAAKGQTELEVPDGSGASQTTVEQGGVVGTVPLTTFGSPPMEGASEQ